ncbi:MAG: 2-oxo acid dehydrogenase subunit E2, partial [Bacteroidales bacterium]|nr:2-oxo acid dehydrogenase subunit E2 [Bacteroidales bacterium]
ADGTLLEILYDDGAEVPVLANVAFIGEPGESVELSGEQAPPEKDKFVSGPDEEIRTASAADAEPVPSKAEPAATRDQKIRISPRARRYAEKMNIDFTLVSGSGPNGRIVCSDIQNALSGQTPVTSAETAVNPVTPVSDLTNVSDLAPESVAVAATIPEEEFTEQPLSNVRKLIAKAMYSSLRDSAQLTHHMSADVRNVLEARRKIKEGLKNGTERHDITINDIVSYCVIKAIARHPAVNAHFLGESIRLFKRVHLGIAVDTPRGLMVPAVKNADLMDLPELSQALRASAEACRKGNINPELIQSTSASFTISNLGNYGVEMFTPVINLPQCAILGVCTIINRPADLGNNIFGFVPYMGLSLTYDHRAVDGGPATLFLREIKEQIEQFSF